MSRHSYVGLPMLMVICLLGLFFVTPSHVTFSKIFRSLRPTTPVAASVQSTSAICTGTPIVKRVAIVGAGSAGTSAAYYLSRAAGAGEIDPCLKLNITIFERSSYIGGRSTTVQPYTSQPGSSIVHDSIELPDEHLNPYHSQPVLELGGSVFVRVNKNLLHAAESLNLTIQSAGHGRPKTAQYALGVWDGATFRFLSREKDSWWFELGKLFYKYGLAPLWTQRAMKETVGKFQSMYEEPQFPWVSLTEVVRSTGLDKVTGVTGRDHIEAKGITKAFAQDVIQASTRVNYAQNLEQIHGLETMVCMAVDGALSIKGGNWQIFSGMAKTSGANVLLNTSVTAISSRDASKDGARFEVSYLSSQNVAGLAVFDDLILATPLQFASVDTTSLSPAIQAQLPKPIDYVHLHVTLLASRHIISPSFFDLASNDDLPETILTTLPAVSSGKTPDFFSISTLRNLTNPVTGEREYAYKIFSPLPANASFLGQLFDFDEKDIKSHISWLYPYEWDSYPYLPPVTKFDGPKLGDGLWYTSGIESFISTMETSSLSGANIARLIADDWNAGQEAADITDQSTDEHQDI